VRPPNGAGGPSLALSRCRESLRPSYRPAPGACTLVSVPPADNSKRRLFRLLRRGARAGTAGAGRSVADESALWGAHQRAALAVRDSGEAAQRIASHVAKQRSTVDALADRARAVSARALDLSTSFSRIVDSFARLELVALNAGLEGARMGEGAAQAMGLVADEVRAQSTRGSEASRELSTTLAEIGSELLQVNASLDRAREASAEVAQEAARVGGASADAERALVDIGDRLRKATGSDPETARAIGEATDHARALVTALAALSGKVPQALVVGALRPVLEPLTRMLDGDDEEQS
jgi:methyl-accepting chemotaxis protein